MESQPSVLIDVLSLKRAAPLTRDERSALEHFDEDERHVIKALGFAEWNFVQKK